MKTTNRLLILITIVLLSFSTTSCDQGKAKKENIKGIIKDNNVHIITLNVNTDSITKDYIEKYSNFGQADTISNKEYTITVNVGDYIIWNSVPSNSSKSDEVNIRKIEHEKGTNVFDKDSISGNEMVVGKVRHSTKNKPDYKYKIFFTVIHDGKKKQYQIDPKIQVN